jgi:cell division protein DivIC
LKKDKRKKKSIKMRIPFLIFLVLLASGCYTVVAQQFKLADMNNTVQELKQQAAQVQDNNEELSRAIDNAGTPEYIEQQARDKLGWVKESEIKFIEQ